MANWEWGGRELYKKKENERVEPVRVRVEGRTLFRFWLSGKSRKEK